MSEQNMTDSTVNDQDVFVPTNDIEREIAIENGIQVTETTDHSESESNVTNDEPQGEVNTDSVQESNDSDPFKEEESTEVSDQDSTSEMQTQDMPKGFQKQLKRNKRTIDRMKKELEDARKELQQFKTQSTEQPQVKQDVTRDNFTSDAEYLDYLATQKANEYVTNLQQQQQEAAAKEKQVTDLTNSWNSKIDNNFKTEEEKSDYKSALQSLGNPANVFRPEITQYIFNNENGPRLLKYFADRPNAINQVNNMHPYDLVDTMKRINEYVSQSSRPQAKPVQPVGGLTNKAPGHNTRSVDEMSDDELIAAFNAGKL